MEIHGPCEHDRDYTVACFFVKLGLLGRHVNHDERMLDIYGSMIATKLLCISLSILADMLTMVRGWTLLILEVRGQRSRSQ